MRPKGFHHRVAIENKGPLVATSVAIDITINAPLRDAPIDMIASSDGGTISNISQGVYKCIIPTLEVGAIAYAYFETSELYEVIITASNITMDQVDSDSTSDILTDTYTPPVIQDIPDMQF